MLFTILAPTVLLLFWGFEAVPLQSWLMSCCQHPPGLASARNKEGKLSVVSHHFKTLILHDFGLHQHGLKVWRPRAVIWTEASIFVCTQLAAHCTVYHDSRQNGKILFVLDHLLKTAGRWKMEGKEYGLCLLASSSLVGVESDLLLVTDVPEAGPVCCRWRA